MKGGGGGSISKDEEIEKGLKQRFGTVNWQKDPDFSNMSLKFQNNIIRSIVSSSDQNLYNT